MWNVDVRPRALRRAHIRGVGVCGNLYVPPTTNVESGPWLRHCCAKTTGRAIPGLGWIVHSGTGAVPRSEFNTGAGSTSGVSTEARLHMNCSQVQAPLLRAHEGSFKSHAFPVTPIQAQPLICNIPSSWRCMREPHVVLGVEVEWGTISLP